MKTKSKLLSAIRVCQLLSVMTVLSMTASSSVFGSDLRLWYEQPADDWQHEALPIGNGRMGGMLFGRYDQEIIHFNVDSLWTGDNKIRGDYQSFGYVLVKFDDASKPTDYRRELDLSRALHTTRYKQNGAQITQQAFCSHPARVLVWRLTSDKPISGELFLHDDHGAVPQADGKSGLYCRGKINNGLPYESRMGVSNKDGSVQVRNKESKTAYRFYPGNRHNREEWPKNLPVVAPRTIRFEDCTELTIYLAADTGYTWNSEIGFIGEVPTDAIKGRIENAQKKSYANLLDEHVKDHSSLFDRCDVQISGDNVPNDKIPMDQRFLKDRRDRSKDLDLERLLFQYGRYMLIGSSRAGGLPANLQGLWNHDNTPSWGSDYHMNINMQMNYWLTETTGLSECHAPVFDWMWAQRDVWHQNYAANRKEGAVRGWTAQRELGIFGGARAHNNLGCEWMAQDFWEHYDFTQNQEVLRDRAYPIFKEMCEYWDDVLIRREDGTLVTPKSQSSEQGPSVEAVSSDLLLIYELFTMFIDSCDILKVDTDYRNHIAGLRKKLLRPKIGSWGQLQEWEEDWDLNPDAGVKRKNNIDINHRHLSHLVGFHPGRQMTLESTPEFAEAVRKALVARGNGSTGWSRIWRSCLWSRFGDGNKAQAILSGIKFPANGFDQLANAFQIDANLGYTAAVAEMLIQSHQSFIELLPALPDEWKSGKASGFCARGGFEVDIAWKDGKLVKAGITSKIENECNIRYGKKHVTLKLKKGETRELDADLNVIE